MSVIAAAPSCGNTDDNESCSVDVRKIDNGYVTRETKCKGNEYSSKETFSREKPDLDGAMRRETNPGREAMRDAMRELSRK